MKRTLLLATIVFSAFVSVNAVDVINLSTTDAINTVLSTYSGSNVVLVVPSGYTNPQGTNAIDLSTLTNLTATTKITIKGDGTMPTLALKSISLPAALSKIAFKDLTLVGSTTDPTANYVVNQGSALAAVIDSFVVDNCNISTIRSVLRFQGTSPTQGVNNIVINNCIAHNFADYGVIYCSILNTPATGVVGPSLGKLKVSKSTFYGFGASVFALQSNATSVDITDCTFDNIINVTGSKFIVDLKTLVVPVTITNCILGKSISSAKTVSTGGTLTITNTFTTTDWLAAAPTATGGITGAFTAYSGASTDLFTTVSVSTPAVITPASPYTTTIGNYKIKDASFAGANSAGDPRWYLNAISAVKQVLSDKGVSFNGTEILNNKGLALEVYSVLGKRVAASMTSIPTVNFQKGVYIVRISGSNDSLKICI